jgi:hypothetical protein
VQRSALFERSAATQANGAGNIVHLHQLWSLQTVRFRGERAELRRSDAELS